MQISLEISFWCLANNFFFYKSTRTFFFTARLLTSVIEIKLNHLTKHFVILPCEGHHAAASTNPLSEKSQQRTPFSVGKKKNFMIRDSLSFLMLFLLLSHNPISFYVLCSECICVRMCLDIMDSVMIYFSNSTFSSLLKIFAIKKYFFAPGDPFSIKNEVYLNDENHGHG